VHIRLAQNKEFPGGATQEKEQHVGSQLHQLPHCVFTGCGARPAGGYACDNRFVGAHGIKIKNSAGTKGIRSR